MKSAKYFLITWVSLFYICAFAASEIPLAELYKTGKARFVQELVLDDGSMPKNLFFELPTSVVDDQDGNIYVLDSDASNIKKFDSRGRFIKTIGREGQGPGEFSSPYYLTYAKDRLVVWDLMNRRLCALTPEGKFIKSSHIPYDQGSVRKLRSLPTGEILVEKEKSFRRETDKPQVCTIDLYSRDLEYVKTIYERSLWRKKYVRTREFGISTLYFPYSPDVCWDVSPEEKIIIGFSDKYELEVYDRDGKKLQTFSHAYEPVRVTEKDRKEYFDSIEFYRAGAKLKEIPEYITKETQFPKNMPAFENILIDSEGNVLVVLNRENEDEKEKMFDVFDQDGKFLASVRITGDTPFRFSRQTITHDRSFWLLNTGEDELIRVIKYRIEAESMPGE
jgi:hypothetical protein